MVNSLYKELVYRIVDKIKNDLYFCWPKKMSGNASQRNQNLYCSYYWERGHTTKDYRALKDHLSQLEKAGQMKEFIAQDCP